MTSPRAIDPAMLDAPHRSAVSRVLRNSAWLAVGEGGTRVVSLATILYLTRTLAPDGMGAVQFGLAVFGMLQLVCTGGTEAFFVPEAARHPHALRRLAGTSLLVSWAQLGVLFALLAVGGWGLDLAPDMRWSAVAFGVAAVLVPLSLRFAFLGRERARVVGAGALAAQAVFLALCVAVVRDADDVGRVALCWFVATAVRVGGQLAIFVREHGALVFERRGLGAWLGRATMLGTGSIARSLMLNLDVLVLGLFRPADEVASYGLAVKLPLFLVSFATLTYMALFPTLARAVAADELERAAHIEAATLEAVLGIALPAAICLGLAADPLVRMLFTERFRDAAPLLAVLVWRIPLVAATGILRTAVWARRPEADARVASYLLATTAALLAAMASRAGASGVAAGILVGDGLAIALYLRAGGAAALRRVPPRAVARLAGAGAVAFAGMAIVPRAGLVRIAGALAVWACAALVADAPLLRRLAGSWRAPAAR